MRILLIGPGANGKYGTRFFYSNARRLLNGFTLNGHFVLHTSDRDLADYVLKFRPIGKFYARHRLIEIARSLQPHLVVLVHADLVNAETVEAIRKIAPGCRVVHADFDPVSTPRAARRVARMGSFCDYGFSTTGGESLRKIKSHTPLLFIPNLVDPTVDDQKSYENVSRADIFFAGKMSEEKHQWQRAHALRRLAPDLKYFYAGDRRSETESPGGIWGYRYIEQLGHSRIGLNLNRVEGDLYASSRMAQYLGNGCLLATDRASGYQEFFSDDEMLFFSSPEELAHKCTRLLSEDRTWRTMAERGRARALEIMSNTLVCRFIVSVATGDRPPQDWKFSDR
jgi:glycosyltransferase involved in cell wall biosynthesis